MKLEPEELRSKIQTRRSRSLAEFDFQQHSQTSVRYTGSKSRSPTCRITDHKFSTSPTYQRGSSVAHPQQSSILKRQPSKINTSPSHSQASHSPTFASKGRSPTQLGYSPTFTPTKANRSPKQLGYSPIFPPTKANRSPKQSASRSNRSPTMTV